MASERTVDPVARTALALLFTFSVWALAGSIAYYGVYAVWDEPRHAVTPFKMAVAGALLFHHLITLGTAVVAARRLHASTLFTLAFTISGLIVAAYPLLTILTLANDCRGVSSFPLSDVRCPD